MTGTDLDTLAERLLTDLDEVRACLLASLDGDAVGAAPHGRSESALSAWSRLRSLGRARRGFVVLDDEMWAFAAHAGRMGVVVAAPSATPGLLLDRLGVALRTAEDLFEDEAAPAMAPATNGDAAEATAEVSVPPSEHEGPEGEGAVEADPTGSSGGSGASSDRDVDHAALTREFAFLMSDMDRR